MLGFAVASKAVAARLEAIPDSLLGEVPGSGGTTAPTTSMTSADAVLPPGLPPFAATLDFTLQWFSAPPHPDPGAAEPSTEEPVEAPPPPTGAF